MFWFFREYVHFNLNFKFIKAKDILDPMDLFFLHENNASYTPSIKFLQQHCHYNRAMMPSSTRDWLFFHFLLVAATTDCCDAFLVRCGRYRTLPRRQHAVPNNIENDDDCLLDVGDDENCQSLQGFQPTTSSFATVSQVYVAEIESLRNRFDSFEDNDDEANVSTTTTRNASYFCFKR